MLCVCVGLVLVLGTGACFVADEEGDTIITLLLNLLNTEDDLQHAGTTVTSEYRDANMGQTVRGSTNK